MATTTALPGTSLPPQAPPSRPGGRKGAGVWAARLAPALVVAAAVVLAGLAYGRFLQAPRQLWGSALHDRNAHYWLGLCFGLDLRHGAVGAFLHDLHAARVWPPLHALLVGLLVAVGGFDYRLAVLPSLAGWVGAALFAFLAARRAAGRGGNLAGLIAALFVLASPAYRAFATDVMLESLGACLSLAAVFGYLVLVQERSARAGRWLGLALTALFFEKYNYWLLVVLGLAAGEVVTTPRAYLHLARRLVRAFPGRAWLRAQLRQPLNYPLAVAAILVGGLVVAGGRTVRIGRHDISLHSPHTLLTVAYALLVLRLIPWWRESGRRLFGGLDAPLRNLAAWHVLPVLLWFLWPQRLGYCLWFLSPANGGETPRHDLLGGLPYYWHCLTQDYHPNAWSALAALGLAGVAVLTVRRLRPGAAALVCLVLIAAVLTCTHPNRKSRFLHSWIAAGWVAAGVGAAQLVGSLARPRGGLRPVLAAATFGGLALLQGPGLWQPGHAPDGGPRPAQPSALELADCYLPSLAGTRRVAVLSNLPVKFWTGWTFLERYGRPLAFETDLPGFGHSAPENRRAFEAWLRKTDCDRLAFIRIGPDSPFHAEVPYYADYEMVPEEMANQEVFTFRQRWDFPKDDCSVTVWSRADAAAAPATR